MLIERIEQKKYRQGKSVLFPQGKSAACFYLLLTAKVVFLFILHQVQQGGRLIMKLDGQKSAELAAGRLRSHLQGIMAEIFVRSREIFSTRKVFIPKVNYCESACREAN